MKRFNIYIILAGIFMVISGLIYCLHYYIFRDVHHIFIYMVGDLAFLPLEVFLVVIVIERIIARREKQSILQKLNMVVGAFFSEVGTELIKRLNNCFERCDDICQHLTIDQNWIHTDFKKAAAFAYAIEDKPNCLNIDLEGLRTFLVEKRPFMLRLLENPNLLEHERFSDLLWAAFHLTEELEARSTTKDLPDTDLDHIAGDIKRLYSQLVAEWVTYAEHLQSSYPFLFSLVVRTHPFQEQPSPVVT